MTTVSVQPTTSEPNEREAFLKWYQDTWMCSEEKIQQWKNTSVADIAEFAWQHQQKRIDELEKLRDELLAALKKLEDACDKRASRLTVEAYLVAERCEGMREALYDLDDARRSAREAINKAKE